MWYLIVLIPDPCCLSYFVNDNFANIHEKMHNLFSMINLPINVSKTFITSSNCWLCQNNHYMRGSRKFCQRESNFDVFLLFFLVGRGRNDPKTTISGPSSARQ